MIKLTNNPIDSAAILKAVESPKAGAVVLFLGTTRERTDGRQTESLDYECYPEMAERKLAELEAAVPGGGRLSNAQLFIGSVISRPVKPAWP